MSCFCKERKGSGLMVTEKLGCIQNQHYFHPECGPSGNITKCPYCYTPGTFVSVINSEMRGCISKRTQDLKCFPDTGIMASTKLLKVAKKVGPETSQGQVSQQGRGLIVSGSGGVVVGPALFGVALNGSQSGDSPPSPSTSNDDEDEIDTEVSELTDDDDSENGNGVCNGVEGLLGLKPGPTGIMKLGNGGSKDEIGNADGLLATTSNVVNVAPLPKAEDTRRVPELLGNEQLLERSGQTGLKVKGSTGKYVGKKKSKLAAKKTGPMKIPKESRSKHQYTCGKCLKVHGSRTGKFNCCKEPVQCSCGKTFGRIDNLKVHAKKFSHQVL